MTASRSGPAGAGAGPVEVSADPLAPDLDWNLLVTAMQHHAGDVRRSLRPIVDVRSSRFRNVLLARVDDPGAALTAVAELTVRRPALRAWLGKMVPVARTFAVDPDQFTTQAEEALAPLLGEIAGRSFHVRVERRGHKGRIDSHAVERDLGEWILDVLQARKAAARVDFHDPDVVVAVELVGDVAGVALLPRTLREAHEFVRID
jgi:tRNA(Ser,Leu) C12 N-acetylase TAN1